MVKVCECCGHPLDLDEVRRTLTGLQLKIFNVVERSGGRGIAAADIMDLVYADDPSGGPTSWNIIAVVSCQMAPRLAAHGLKLKARRGPGALWRLEKL